MKNITLSSDVSSLDQFGELNLESNIDSNSTTTLLGTVKSYRIGRVNLIKRFYKRSGLIMLLSCKNSIILVFMWFIEFLLYGRRTTLDFLKSSLSKILNIEIALFLPTKGVKSKYFTVQYASVFMFIYTVKERIWFHGVETCK